MMSKNSNSNITTSPSANLETIDEFYHKNLNTELINEYHKYQDKPLKCNLKDEEKLELIIIEYMNYISIGMNQLVKWSSPYGKYFQGLLLAQLNFTQDDEDVDIVMWFM